MFSARGDARRKRIVAIVLAGVAAAAAGLTFVATGTTFAGENVVASGYVRDAAGNPVAGALIALYDAGPTDSTISELPLATTTSASDGSYHVAFIPTSSLSAEAAANGGYNNFYVVATAGAARYFLGITRVYSSGIWTNGSDVTGDDLVPGTSATGAGPNLYCGIEIRKKRIGEQQAQTVIGETRTSTSLRPSTAGRTGRSTVPSTSATRKGLPSSGTSAPKTATSGGRILSTESTSTGISAATSGTPSRRGSGRAAEPGRAPTTPT
jgi:hypothetical protein